MQALWKCHCYRGNMPTDQIWALCGVPKMAYLLAPVIRWGSFLGMWRISRRCSWHDCGTRVFSIDVVDFLGSPIAKECWKLNFFRHLSHLGGKVYYWPQVIKQTFMICISVIHGRLPFWKCTMRIFGVPVSTSLYKSHRGNKRKHPSNQVSKMTFLFPK